MVSSREVHAAFHPEGKVTALGLDSQGTLAAWAEGSGSVFIAVKSRDSFIVSATWIAPARVRGLVFHDETIIVLDDEIGLTCLNADATIVWQQTVGGGGFSLLKYSDGFSVIDGLGRLHLFGFDGVPTNLNETFDDILLQQSVGPYLVLGFENGSVQALNNGLLTWSRPVRGETGEAITCLGSTADNHLVLGREGYALVAGDEEALELEVWSIQDNMLLHRDDLNSRLLHAVPSFKGVACGFDDGKVSYLDVSMPTPTFVTGFDCTYPVRYLCSVGKEVLAASWFFIHGNDADGRIWKIEHQGMPQMVVAADDGSVILFAGEDQNDWTEPEPIGLFSLTAEVVEMDETELNLWFNRPEEPVHLSAEEIYRSDSEMESFFSKEELLSMNQVHDSTVEIDVLQEALGSKAVMAQPVAEDGSLEIDTEALLEHLDDAIAQMALLPQDDLLEQLNAESGEILPPRAMSGGDQNHVPGDDGTAVITLDGSDSYDPQGRIISWSWVDESGKEIADTPKVRVRIGVGNHRFELRICDREGQWSSDSLHVLIEA